MASRRPFQHISAIISAAEDLFASCSDADFLEAFKAHPRIGDVKELEKKFPSTAGLSASEQAGLSGTSGSLLRELADENRRYEAAFGYIYIVCATGRSAAEMLADIRRRMSNAPDVELKTAAAEQMKITKLRLEKLLS